jgi:hypothetical protein
VVSFVVRGTQPFGAVTGAVADVGCGGPVVGYINSLREPTLSYAGDKFPFDEALQEFAARINQVIGTEGRFRTFSRGGIFICRLPRR